MSLVHAQRAWPSAQLALITARTMGGYKGQEIEPFLPPWAQVQRIRKALVNPRVDRSIRTALSLNLLSQDALDLLIEVGFQP